MRRQTAIHPTTVMLPVPFNMTENLFVQVMHPGATRPTMDTALPPLAVHDTPQCLVFLCLEIESSQMDAVPEGL